MTSIGRFRLPLFVSFLLLASASIGHARGFRVGLTPNGSENNCATCHFSPGGGGARNPFGEDVNGLVSRGGREEFWSPELAMEDSDFDGFTNGEELGDIDGDGVPERTVNLGHPGAADILPERSVGDCNLDTVLDAVDLQCVPSVEDRDAVLSALNTVAGDLDGNGNVEFADFLVLSGNFGSDNPSYAAGNIDLAGGVEFADFLVLSGNFGFSSAGAEGNLSAVPEPNGVLLSMLGILPALCLRSRRRR